MATLTDNPYLANTDPKWLQVWKTFNPDDTAGSDKGGLTDLLSTTPESADTMVRRDTGNAPITGWIGTPNYVPGAGPGDYITTPGRPPLQAPLWGPTISWKPTSRPTSDIAKPTIDQGQTFFRPLFPGDDPNHPGEAPIFVLPQLPDPAYGNRTHYNTGAPIYWDPSNVTGGTMGRHGEFVPTGGDVHGLGAAVRVSTTPVGTIRPSGYTLSEGYKKALTEGGPAAAVDYLQSGPRGADGLTDAQRTLVRQMNRKELEGPGRNAFQEYLNALGASATPTGTVDTLTRTGGFGGGVPIGGGQRMSWAEYAKKRRAAGLP